MTHNEVVTGQGYLPKPSGSRLPHPDAKDRIFALSLALFKAGFRPKQKPATWWKIVAQVHTPPWAQSIRTMIPPYRWNQRMMLRNAFSQAMKELSRDHREEHG